MEKKKGAPFLCTSCNVEFNLLKPSPQQRTLLPCGIHLGCGGISCLRRCRECRCDACDGFTEGDFAMHLCGCNYCISCTEKYNLKKELNSRECLWCNREERTRQEKLASFYMGLTPGDAFLSTRKIMEKGWKFSEYREKGWYTFDSYQKSNFEFENLYKNPKSPLRIQEVMDSGLTVQEILRWAIKNHGTANESFIQLAQHTSIMNKTSLRELANSLYHRKNTKDGWAWRLPLLQAKPPPPQLDTKAIEDCLNENGISSDVIRKIENPSLYGYRISM